MLYSRSAILGAALLALVPASARADAISDFYKGKKVSLYIGNPPGGGYDTYGRLLARHLGKYIPGNPSIVVQNMPGAGSLRMANWLYNIAPKDGSALGAPGRGIAFNTLLKQPGSKFDGRKFGWIGSMNNEVSVCVSWNTSGVKTFDEMFKKELVIGGTGGSADTDQFPKILNGVLGTRFKLITGYPGGTDINLAMERGEVKGRCGWSWSSVVTTRPEWLSQKKINVLVQLSLSKHSDLKDVPLVTDIVKTDEQKAVMKLVFARQVLGRPIFTTPNVPADRLAALRKAFDQTMQDKGLKEEAAKAKMEMEAVNGETVQKLIDEAYATPQAVVDQVIKLLAASGGKGK